MYILLNVEILNFKHKINTISCSYKLVRKQFKEGHVLDKGGSQREN